MPDFTSLLDTKVEDVEKAPPMPQGSWNLEVGTFEVVSSSKKGTPGVQIQFKPLAPGNDVDEELLEQYSEKADYKGQKLSRTFWLTDGAAYMLREFVECCGVDHSGRTFKQVLPEIVGCEVMGFITQTPSQRPGDARIFNEITSFTPVP